MGKVRNFVAGGLAVLGSVVPGYAAINSEKINSQRDTTNQEIVDVFAEKQDNSTDTFQIGIDTIDHENFIHRNINEIFDEYGEEKGLLMINQHLLIELNKIRVQNGSRELVLDDQIMQLAQQQAVHLDSLGKIFHENFGSRLDAHNIEYSSYGENLGLGQLTIDTIVKERMTSPGHSSNIKRWSFKKMGVGVKYHELGSIWVLNFVG